MLTKAISGPMSTRRNNIPRNGASYTFGRVAVLSVDYERDWYNGIRMKEMPEQPSGMTMYDFKQNFKTFYKGSNTLRIGAEFRPLPMLAVRAGYGYNGSMLKDSDIILSSPVVYQTNYYTAGLGISFKRAYIDLAYPSQRGADARIPLLKAYT